MEKVCEERNHGLEKSHEIRSVVVRAHSYDLGNIVATYNSWSAIVVDEKGEQGPAESRVWCCCRQDNELFLVGYAGIFVIEQAG